MAVLAVPLATAMGASAATAATIGTVASVASLGFQGLSIFKGMQESNAQAKAARVTGAYTAESARQNAIQEVASSQRVAQETQRKGTLIQSRALAEAASGGGASDPSIINAIGDLAGQTEYNRLSDLYQGNERAAALNQGADLSTYEANNSARALKAKGTNDAIKSGFTLLDSPSFGTGVTAAKSLYDKYAIPSLSGGGNTMRMS